MQNSVFSINASAQDTFICVVTSNAGSFSCSLAWAGASEFCLISCKFFGLGWEKLSLVIRISDHGFIREYKGSSIKEAIIRQANVSSFALAHVDLLLLLSFVIDTFNCVIGQAESTYFHITYYRSLLSEEPCYLYKSPLKTPSSIRTIKIQFWWMYVLKCFISACDFMAIHLQISNIF